MGKEMDLVFAMLHLRLILISDTHFEIYRLRRNAAKTDSTEISDVLMTPTSYVQTNS